MRIKNKVIIIGGGIHGLSTAIALAKKKLIVTLLEKNQIFSGTSSATHNRAHLGFHYPRSLQTAKECYEGLKIFQKKYKHLLSWTDEAYYAIAKNFSLTNVKEYLNFCKIMDLSLEEKWPKRPWLNKNSVITCFRVVEPIYNTSGLCKCLVKEALEKGVKICTGVEIIKGDYKNKKFQITARKNKRKVFYESDVLINATYSQVNKIIYLFGLAQDMIHYELQTTEVVVVKSPSVIPAVTIIDGPFTSIMPYAGYPKNIGLVYHAKYSVHHKQKGFFYSPIKKQTNWELIQKDGSFFIPNYNKLIYIKSLFASRPIPININKIKGFNTSRVTRIIHHKHLPGFFTIAEGKFISAISKANYLSNLVEKFLYKF